MGRFTQKAENALNLSMTLAEEMGHSYIGSEHALLALLKDKSSCAFLLLNRIGINEDRIDRAIKRSKQSDQKKSLTVKDTTPRYRKIIEGSYKIAQKYSSEKIGTEHILLAILDEKNSTAEKVLERAGYETDAVKDEVLTFLRSIEKNCSLLKPKETSSGITTLIKYGRNLTEEARNSGRDPVIGRERETDRLIRILSRRTKNNPCLIGDAGVGKTAIVEGVAQRIAENNVPDSLINKTLISLDLTSMIAGAKYRGDFEDRIKNIIEEVRRYKEIILFIDEIHTIVGAGAAEGAIDAANILKPALARGEIHLIGATTPKEYKKYIESDSALERRFQPLFVEEPSAEKTVEILKGLKNVYEGYHGVLIEEDAINASVELSKKYIRDRFFPDKAIDVLDEACARASIISSGHAKHLRFSDNIIGQKIICEEKPEFSEALALILDRERRTQIEPATVNKATVFETVEEMIGIPISDTDIYTNVRDLEERLNKRIIGQSKAISEISNAIIRNTASVVDEERPLGVFMLCGVNGTDKTELIKALSYEVFQNSDSLIRYDMSEFSETHSISKLIGSPPGYVGYNDHQTLTDRIRNRPYSIVLFDEIEKAHSDVIGLIIQLCETGIITDSGGRSADFRNAYIFLTVTITDNLSKEGSLGFVARESKSYVNDELKKIFDQRLFANIDEIIILDPISKENLEKIADIKLLSLKKRMESRAFKLEYDGNIERVIAEKAINEKSTRSVERVISDLISTEIAKLIIQDPMTSGARVYCENGQIKVCSLNNLLKQKGPIS